MGVEYRIVLVPRPIGFRPSARQLATLVHSLAAENWIPGEAGELHLDELHGDGDAMPASPDAAWFAALPTEYLLQWTVDSLGEAGLRYPFVTAPDPDAYYAIRLELSDDYVYRSNEQVDPFDATLCPCGAELARDVDEDDLYFSQRIAQTCASCGAAVDPSAWPAAVRDPRTGEERIVPGGATSRFAIVIDCGKCLPSDEYVPLAPQLIDVCTRALGVELHPIEEIY